MNTTHWSISAGAEKWALGRQDSTVGQSLVWIVSLRRTWMCWWGPSPGHSKLQVGSNEVSCQPLICDPVGHLSEAWGLRPQISKNQTPLPNLYRCLVLQSAFLSRSWNCIWHFWLERDLPSLCWCLPWTHRPGSIDTRLLGGYSPYRWWLLLQFQNHESPVWI